MTRNTYLKRIFLAIGLCLLGSACTSEPATSGSQNGGSLGGGGAPYTGGVSGSGGSGPSASGGSANGGTTSGGGSGGSGGVPASGGTTSTGASTATGGRTSSGGAPGSGGATSSSGSGGASGATSTGGAVATGGSKSTGGGIGSGGTTRTDGGVTSTGGNTATGGARSTGGGGATGAGGSPHADKRQIMPLGDSITGFCYPQLLSKELIDKGHTSFAFVGTVTNNQSCGTGAPNVQTEGHGGYLVTYLTTDSPAQSGKGTLTELKTWAAEKPDVVLMEIGTNDVWSSIATATITIAFSFVIDQFRAQNPSVIFFVAQITPLNPSGCSGCESRVEALNAAIPAWASGKSTSDSPVYVVDVWSALDPATYLPNSTWTKDGCHPELPASQLMADKWYAGLVAQGIP